MKAAGYWNRLSEWQKELRSARSAWVLWVGGAAILAAWIAYAFRFAPEALPEWLVWLLKNGLWQSLAGIAEAGGHDSEKAKAAWGQLGDFLGGVLNPLLSFLALLAVVRTLRLSAVQLEQSRQSQEAANLAGKINALHSAASILTEQINQMLDVQSKGGTVNPTIYQHALDQRQKLAEQILKMSQELMKMPT